MIFFFEAKDFSGQIEVAEKNGRSRRFQGQDENISYVLGGIRFVGHFCFQLSYNLRKMKEIPVAMRRGGEECTKSYS